MKWFQHSVDSHDDPDISDAEDLFGDAGYNIFFKILELYGREFNHLDDEGNWVISQTFLRRKLRKSWTKVEQTLNFYQKRKRIFYLVNGKQISIQIPQFLDIASNWTKRPKKKPKTNLCSPSVVPTAIEVEEEVEEEDIKKEQQIDYSHLQKNTDNICKTLTGYFSKFNFYAWRQEQINKQKHPEAIEECLQLLWKNRKKVEKGPRPYLIQLMKIKGPNAFERIEVAEHEKRKEEELSYDGHISGIFKGIKNPRP